MVRSLDDIRKEVRHNIEINNRLKELAYKSFYDVLNNSKELIYISNEQLKTLTIGERVKVSGNDDVEFIKISETDNKMVFQTIMIEGGKFTEHFHDWIEITEVLEGSMIETVKGERNSPRLLRVGDRAIYDKGEKHAMHVNEYTLLRVTFLKEIE